MVNSSSVNLGSATNDDGCGPERRKRRRNTSVSSWFPSHDAHAASSSAAPPTPAPAHLPDTGAVERRTETDDAAAETSQGATPSVAIRQHGQSLFPVRFIDPTLRCQTQIFQVKCCWLFRPRKSNVDSGRIPSSAASASQPADVVAFGNASICLLNFPAPPLIVQFHYSVSIRPDSSSSSSATVPACPSCPSPGPSYSSSSRLSSTRYPPMMMTEILDEPVEEEVKTVFFSFSIVFFPLRLKYRLANSLRRALEIPDHCISQSKEINL